MRRSMMSSKRLSSVDIDFTSHVLAYDKRRNVLDFVNNNVVYEARG